MMKRLVLCAVASAFLMANVSGMEGGRIPNVYIKTMDGETITLRIDEALMGGTVLDMKRKIAEHTGYPVDQQRIIFCGKVEQDADEIRDCYPIWENEGMLHLVINPPQTVTGVAHEHCRQKEQELERLLRTASGWEKELEAARAEVARLTVLLRGVPEMIASLEKEVEEAREGARLAFTRFHPVAGREAWREHDAAAAPAPAAAAPAAADERVKVCNACTFINPVAESVCETCGGGNFGSPKSRESAVLEARSIRRK